jgi:hypothetical protein
MAPSSRLTVRPFGLAIVAVVALAVVALAVVGSGLLSRAPSTNPVDDHARGGPGTRVTPSAVAGEEGGADGEQDENLEAEEQAEEVAERLEAIEEAKEQGRYGQRAVAVTTPAPGWAGEVPFGTTADDWEPAIAADPAAPWVYALVTRYGTDKPCPGNCPTPYIAIRISSDGGATWGPDKPLCACKGGGQFDPIIEVVPSTGQVYSVFMIGFNVWFIKSTDHGKTWSAPVKTYGNVSWNDKPVLAMTDDGKDVYVSFNGPTGGDPFAAVSHDAGATWTQTKLVNSREYFFAFDADVASDGTVYFSESALDYGSAGKGSSVQGTIKHHVFVSRDKGASWEDHLVATVSPGLVCVAEGCTPDFYVGHTALSVDAAGAAVVLYDAATTLGGPQTIEARHSADGGRTWSGPVTLSTVGEESTAPAIESGGARDVRAWWYQTNGGNVDRWNIWFRRSADGGATWSSAVKISDAGSGAGYKTPDGFAEVYGDYGELAINSAGKTVAIWGEGFSYTGPGGVWINREK